VIEAVRFNLLPLKRDFAPSHRYLYWNTRLIETREETDNPKTDLTQIDCGATLRDTIKAVKRYGLAPDPEWDDSHDFREKPSKQVYDDAQKHLIGGYRRVPSNMLHMKSVFMMDKPFVFGMAVFASMMSKAIAKTGIVPMPGSNDAPIGGHAPLAVGFDQQYVFFLNSWGRWGDQGFGYLPWDYMLNPSLVGDMWLLLPPQAETTEEKEAAA
jgi:hypothetical protein